MLGAAALRRTGVGAPPDGDGDAAGRSGSRAGSPSVFRRTTTTRRDTRGPQARKLGSRCSKLSRFLSDSRNRPRASFARRSMTSVEGSTSAKHRENRAAREASHSWALRGGSGGAVVRRRDGFSAESTAPRLRGRTPAVCGRMHSPSRSLSRASLPRHRPRRVVAVRSEERGSPGTARLRARRPAASAAARSTSSRAPLARPRR